MDTTIKSDVLSVIGMCFAIRMLEASCLWHLQHVCHSGSSLASYTLHFHCSEERNFSWQISIFQHGKYILSVLQMSWAHCKNLVHTENLTAEPLSKDYMWETLVEKRQRLLSYGNHHYDWWSFIDWHSLCELEAGRVLFLTFVILLPCG